MKNKKDITEPYVGMRIKMALPTSYCEVPSKKPLQWLKGKVISMPNNNTIVVSIWSKKWKFRIDDMMCFRKNGKFIKIVEQL